MQPPKPQPSIADLRRRPSAPPPGTSFGGFSVVFGELKPRCFSNGAMFFFGGKQHTLLWEMVIIYTSFEKIGVKMGILFPNICEKNKEVCSIYNSENMNHTSKHCGNKIPSRYGKLI